MSSLPPYNPSRSERVLWLVNRGTPEGAMRTLLASVPPAERVDSDDPGELFALIEATSADMVVVAAEEALQSLVLTLIGGRPGTARLRFLPGAVSQLQMLSGQAVLRHLNRGAVP